MEEYRKRIKQRSLLLTIGMIPLLLIAINHRVQLIDIFVPAVNIEVSNFQQGILWAMILIGSITMIRYTNNLRDAKKLAILYNQEHDERQKMIKQKAGIPMIIITSSLMIFSGIVAGYYNITIFYVLIITGAIQLTIGAAVKIIFMIRYS